MEGNHRLQTTFVHVREPRRLNRGNQRTRHDPLVKGSAAMTVDYFAVLPPLPRIPEQPI